MPQSAEHLLALHALGVRHGVLAVTKTDLMEADLAAAEALEQIAATSLGDLPWVARQRPHRGRPGRAARRARHARRPAAGQRSGGPGPALDRPPLHHPRRGPGGDRNPGRRNRPHRRHTGARPDRRPVRRAGDPGAEPARRRGVRRGPGGVEPARSRADRPRTRRRPGHAGHVPLHRGRRCADPALRPRGPAPGVAGPRGYGDRQLFAAADRPRHGPADAWPTRCRCGSATGWCCATTGASRAAPSCSTSTRRRWTAAARPGAAPTSSSPIRTLPMPWASCAGGASSGSGPCARSASKPPVAPLVADWLVAPELARSLRERLAAMVEQRSSDPSAAPLHLDDARKALALPDVRLVPALVKPPLTIRDGVILSAEAPDTLAPSVRDSLVSPGAPAGPSGLHGADRGRAGRARPGGAADRRGGAGRPAAPVGAGCGAATRHGGVRRCGSSPGWRSRSRPGRRARRWARAAR